MGSDVAEMTNFLHREITLKAVVEGDVNGQILAAKTPLSFWGGVDAHTGKIIDVRHELCGVCLKDKVLLIPESRGSCSSSGIILEMIRCGTAPAAIITMKAEAILVAGSIIGRELYGRYVPVFVISALDYAKLSNGDSVVLKNNVMLINKAS